MARAKEDDPVTWETLIYPRKTRHYGEAGPQCLRRAAGWWVHQRPTKKSAHDEVGQRQGKTVVEADVDEGVGGLRTSDDVGEREGTRTRPSKGGPC